MNDPWCHAEIFWRQPRSQEHSYLGTHHSDLKPVLARGPLGKGSFHRAGRVGGRGAGTGAAATAGDGVRGDFSFLSVTRTSLNVRVRPEDTPSGIFLGREDVWPGYLPQGQSG